MDIALFVLALEKYNTVALTNELDINKNVNLQQ